MDNNRTPEVGDYRKLFVIGCPRSGTTWLQLLLAQHAEVATAPETQIFAYYLNQLEQQWRHEHDAAANGGQGRAGLSRVLSRDEFLHLCRVSARVVLDKIRESRPDCAVVVEKSPKHALHTSFIQQLFPDAMFLHLIRDPRDTTASLLAASRSWGRDWAPPNAVLAARMWVDHVEEARRVADAAGRYHEVRYERMKADPVGQLQEILKWAGVSAERAECEAAVAACDFGELQRRRSADDLPLPGSESPHGFFRRGEAGGWRAELSRSDVRVVEHIAGRWMDELGYERSSNRSARPWRVALHDGVQRVRESIDWQLSRVLTRL